jgi:hypothetical protein
MNEDRYDENGMLKVRCKMLGCKEDTAQRRTDFCDEHLAVVHRALGSIQGSILRESKVGDETHNLVREGAVPSPANHYDDINTVKYGFPVEERWKAVATGMSSTNIDPETLKGLEERIMKAEEQLNRNLYQLAQPNFGICSMTAMYMMPREPIPKPSPLQKAVNRLIETWNVLRYGAGYYE